MVDIIQIINAIPQVVSIVMKILLISIAIFFGKIAVSGWRGKLDFLTKILAIFALGFASFFVGMLIPLNLFPKIAILSESINYFIVAVVLYIILFLLSTKIEEKHNIPFVAGSVLAVAFLVFVFFSVTPQGVDRISESLSYYGFSFEELSCAPPDVLIKKWNSNDGRLEKYNFNMTQVASAVDNNIGENLSVSQFLYGYPVAVELNGTYGAFFATEEKVDSLPSALSTIQSSMISGANYICSVNLKNSKVCSCEKMSNPKLVAVIAPFLNNLKDELQQNK